MFKKSVFVALTAAALLVVGCANQKDPALKAVADAEAALSAVKDDAAKYVPGDLAAAETSLSGLKDSAAKGDYKAVLAGAPAVMTQLGSLKDAAAAKKTEMDAAIEKAKGDWTALAKDVPAMVGALSSRLDILGKAKKLPAGLDAAKVTAAKTGLDGIKATWDAATAAFASGNVLDAVSKANEVKTKGAEIMASLGMTAG